MEEDYEAGRGEVLLDGEDDDGWLATHGRPKESKANDHEDLPSMDALELSNKGNTKSISSYFGGEEKEDIPDMSEFEETENVVGTDTAAPQSTYLVAQMMTIF